MVRYYGYYSNKSRRFWRSPPTEAFIIYDESSSPGADDDPIRSSMTV